MVDCRIHDKSPSDSTASTPSPSVSFAHLISTRQHEYTIKQSTMLARSLSSVCRKCQVSRSLPVVSHRPPVRKFSTDIILQTIQTGLTTLHTVSGAPWWLTIGMSTLFVRTSLFPLVRFQIISSRTLSKAMPEINFLFKLLQNRLSQIPSSESAERRKVVTVFLKGVKACFVLHEVSMFEVFFYPVINLALFFSFVYSVRDMVLHGSLDLKLEEGGALWFKDLSEKDKTFTLPLMAIGLSYGALELALGSSVQGRMLFLIKDALQSTLLLSIPFLTSLPSGVFCYWIPSTIFGIMQSLALKNSKFVKLFRLPALATSSVKKV
jgi:membrane protein insertase Oxa1/YidC/SpoIIIJ